MEGFSAESRLSYSQQALVSGCGGPALASVVQQRRQMASRAHVETFRDPRQRHRRLRTQLPGQLDFPRLPLPPRLQVGLAPAHPFQPLHHPPLSLHRLRLTRGGLRWDCRPFSGNGPGGWWSARGGRKPAFFGSQPQPEPNRHWGWLCSFALRPRQTRWCPNVRRNWPAKVGCPKTCANRALDYWWKSVPSQ